jgi:hypothetical protein
MGAGVEEEDRLFELGP